MMIGTFAPISILFSTSVAYLQFRSASARPETRIKRFAFAPFHFGGQPSRLGLYGNHGFGNIVGVGSHGNGAIGKGEYAKSQLERLGGHEKGGKVTLAGKKHFGGHGRSYGQEKSYGNEFKIHGGDDYHGSNEAYHEDYYGDKVGKGNGIYGQVGLGLGHNDYLGHLGIHGQGVYGGHGGPGHGLIGGHGGLGHVLYGVHPSLGHGILGGPGFNHGHGGVGLNGLSHNEAIVPPSFVHVGNLLHGYGHEHPYSGVWSPHHGVYGAHNKRGYGGYW